jgi:glutaredoxin-related protein
MILAFDFDETIGCSEPLDDWLTEIIGSRGGRNSDWVRRIADAAREKNIQLMLWTNRSGWLLARAVHFCASRGIDFDFVNCGPWWSRLLQFIGLWSAKPPYDRIEDDKNGGIALITGPNGKPCVDFDIEGPNVLAWLELQPPTSAAKCHVPPLNWRCTRPAGHCGPCAAIPTNQ